MVTIKQLDPKYPRLGYEIKKGFVIDLPRGDGKASIANENGSLYLSEGSCVVTVNPDTIQMADDAILTVKMHRHEDANHLTLSDLTVDDQLPPTEVGGLFLSSVVERLKADSLPKDSVL